MGGDVMPALRCEGVGAQHKAVGEFQKRLTPGRVHPAAALGVHRGMVAPEGQVGPQPGVAAQLRPHHLRPVKTRVRPQHPRVWPLAQQAVHRVGVAVGMQQQAVLTRQRHQVAGHWQVGIGAVEVKFTHAGIAVLGQALRHVARHAVVAHPAAHLTPAAVGPQHRHDQVRRLGQQQLVAVVVAGRHHGATQPGRPQDGHRLLGWHQVPGVVAVVDVGVKQQRRGRAGYRGGALGGVGGGCPSSHCEAQARQRGGRQPSAQLAAGEVGVQGVHHRPVRRS